MEKGIKIKVNAKCSDLCQISVQFANSELITNGFDYVPSRIGFGNDTDYLEFTIDNDTGKIEGWKPLTKNQIKKAIG